MILCVWLCWVGMLRFVFWLKFRLVSCFVCVVRVYGWCVVVVKVICIVVWWWRFWLILLLSSVSCWSSLKLFLLVKKCVSIC